MNWETFFETRQGQIVVIGAILIAFLLVLIRGKGKKADVRGLVLSAIFVALYMVLDTLSLYRMPSGGSVTPFSMLVIIVATYVMGIRRGLMTGMVAGFMDLLINPYVIHPVQLLLDYPLAVGSLALAGIAFLKRPGKKSAETQTGPAAASKPSKLAALFDSSLVLIPGSVLGCLGRYFCTFLSGTIFFGEYAPEGFNAVTWSLYYNGLYIGIELVLTIALLCVPSVRELFARLRREYRKYLN
ncbi:MAG: energy-coupled thiamine transporter ThiT [Clostridiales bacterium]|nr:energy-coupled thiamine transporter ThiT [Clostridiales bacterium]